MLQEKLRATLPGLSLAAVFRVLITLLVFAFPAAAEEIRIELSRGRPAARLDGPGARMTQGGRSLEASGPRHELAALGGNLLLDGRKLEGEEPLLVQPGTGRLRVNGRLVPGRLEAWADPRGLFLVNVLELEDYVAAVVASEVPKDWRGGRTWAPRCWTRCTRARRIRKAERSGRRTPPPAKCSPTARRRSPPTSAPRAAGGARPGRTRSISPRAARPT